MSAGADRVVQACPACGAVIAVQPGAGLADGLLVAQARAAAIPLRNADHIDRRAASAIDALAKALEARDRRIAELEAGLRRIVHSVPLEPHPSAEPKFRTIQRIARDLLNRERS